MKLYRHYSSFQMEMFKADLVSSILIFKALSLEFSIMMPP